MVNRIRYAVIGTGSRAGMYIDALTGAHSEDGELAALIDLNTGRLQYYSDRIQQKRISNPNGLRQPSLWNPTDLEKAIEVEKIDRVIVTSPDFTHAAMVSRALYAGADVVVEKPLTINAEGSRMIADAVRSSGHSVVMTFNYRYSPRNSALRRVIQSGTIGQPLSIHFEWLLDTSHGADYFRRWHRDKRNSGGLLIHKASHHFDLVNWWIDDVPKRVYASGGLRFYGAANGRRDGRDLTYTRGSLDTVRDPFALDLRADPQLKALYFDNESLDGYWRDKSVFDPGITIEDTLSLVVDYTSGVSMSYSLTAHSPWEGYRVAINGTRGRVEMDVVERGAVLLDESDDHVVDPSARRDPNGGVDLRPQGERICVQQHWGKPYEIPIEKRRGGHGGGDQILLHDVFVGTGDDPLSRRAHTIDGIKAVAVGIAGNRSLLRGEPINIVDLNLGIDCEALGRESLRRKKLGFFGVNGGPGYGAPYSAPGAEL